MLKTDILIAGAGPAGTACALRLMQLKQQCLLVDSQNFPRNKLCGGLLTQKANKAFQSILSKEDFEKFCAESTSSIENKIKLYWGLEKFAEFQTIEPIRLVERFKMDNWLFQHYKKIGGEAIEGDGINTVDFDNRIAKLSSGKEIQYNYLVVADGANSRVKQLLAKGKKDFEAILPNILYFEVNVDKEDFPNAKDVNIYYNIVKDLYSWVFSKGDKVCIGIGKYLNSSIDGKKIILNFMKNLGVKNIDKYPIMGAMSYINLYQKVVWKKHILMVGDAGCFIDPITGEGISFAAQTGIYAAESIYEKNKNNSDIEKVYLSKIKPIYKLIKDGAVYYNLYRKSRLMKTISKIAGKKEKFLSYFYDERIDKGELTPYWLIVLKYKLSKLFSKFTKK